MFSNVKKIEMPHVFTLLTIITIVCAMLTYVIPSGSYERETKSIGGSERTMVIPDTFTNIEKNYSIKAATIGEEINNKASPVSLTQLISAIPRGMEKAADIIFFIFMLGGVFGILNRTGTIVAVLDALVQKFKNSASLLTVLVMMCVAIAGSTLGMGEEFIPMVPLFIIMAERMGYDRIYGLCLVMLAADIGFAAATINPFTVGIAKGIAEVPLGSDLIFRLIFASIIFVIAVTYVLRYGAKIKKDPSLSLVADIPFQQSDDLQQVEPLNSKHIKIVLMGTIIFCFIIFASIELGWWMNEMSGGFFLIAILAMLIAKMSLKDAANSFVKGMEDMVVAAIVVGFASAIEVVLSDGKILDTIVYSAASLLSNVHNVVAAQGMLVFQTLLNFFIPSGSGQAAVTMPIMTPLADALGLSRTTAVFAFTCGDGFSNSVVPTSGVLMAMLSLAKIPYQQWLKFMMPLFAMLILTSAVFLSISVYIHV